MIGVDTDTVVVLCRVGQPLRHSIELAEHPLDCGDCDLLMNEQVVTCGDASAVKIHGCSDDLLALVQHLSILALI